MTNRKVHVDFFLGKQTIAFRSNVCAIPSLTEEFNVGTSKRVVTVVVELVQPENGLLDTFYWVINRHKSHQKMSGFASQNIGNKKACKIIF